MSTDTFYGRLARVLVWGTAALLVGLLGPAAPVAALSAQSDDPDLEQQIDPDQEVASDEAVLVEGHVDLGPRFDGGAWTLMVHDDTRIEGSVWRRLENTALHVLDAARLQVPDDEAYAFLGVDPGAQVHVVPQTQNAEVVWLGWNTQDPEVMSRIDRGVTLTLTGVTGPGDLIVYLQAGGFGPPEVLWDSREGSGQDLWVDVNTHTHANWVFTEPGVYLVEITASADVTDGSTVSDAQHLRLAVGSDVDPAEALSAEPDPSEAPAEADEAAVAEDERGEANRLLWIAIGAAVVGGLLLGALLATLRARAAKRRALGEPDGSEAPRESSQR